MRMTHAEFADIMAAHAEFLQDEHKGKRAVFAGADLSDIPLYGLNLRRVNLSLVNLHGRDLAGTDLFGANLYAADLAYTNLYEANLRHAKLPSANLYRANLERANLQGANAPGADFRYALVKDADFTGANIMFAIFEGAKLEQTTGAELFLAQSEILPREGEVIGWKKCQRGAIVKLRISPAARRSNAPGGRKCRAEFAQVLAIEDDLGNPITEAHSLHATSFVYRVGEIARSDRWCSDRFTECSNGIHFYLTREEAKAHH